MERSGSIVGNLSKGNRSISDAGGALFAQAPCSRARSRDAVQNGQDTFCGKIGKMMPGLITKKLMKSYKNYFEECSK